MNFGGGMQLLLPRYHKSRHDGRRVENDVVGRTRRLRPSTVFASLSNPICRGYFFSGGAGLIVIPIFWRCSSWRLFSRMRMMISAS